MSEWNQILHEEWYSREEPDEIVVNFANLLKNKNKELRVLDLGCGAGRHLVCMAKQSLEAHGTDISETGLCITKERLKRQRLEAFLVKCDMKMLPYKDSCFDAVICLHAVYHQQLKGIQETISEIRRILRKRGSLLINFLSKRTYSYGKGIEVEENTFIEEEGVERGVLHYFAGREEIEHLFKNFETASLELSETKADGKLRSRWIITATV
jgi:ubiquinone/menaquinone biosynthesis C-methylase UbiE